MKKLFYVLALAAFVACNDSATGDKNDKDSIKEVIDSTKDVRVDSVRDAADSAKDAVDSASLKK